MEYLCKQELTLKDCEKLHRDIDYLKKELEDPKNNKKHLTVKKLRDLAFLARKAVYRLRKTKLNIC